MFSWCFGRRKRSTSSIGDAVTMQTPLHFEKSLFEPKEEEQPKCVSRNPFIIDLVVEVMLKEANLKTLKTLREMNSNWNTLDLKELEKRAVKGRLDEISFYDGSDIDFLEDTARIPQLFHSFRLDFPKSFNFISSFYPKYTPIFLHLEIPIKTKFTDLIKKYLYNFFSWAAPTLQELEVEKIGGFEKVTLSKIPSPNGHPLVFQKLTKLNWNMGDYYYDGIDYIDHIPFKLILDRTGAVDPTPNLTSLKACINSGFLRMMDNGPTAHRWSKLTHLRISEGFRDDDSYAKFPATLRSFGQAGMCLKSFAVRFAFPPPEVAPEMFGLWSQFFGTQAKSLQILELEWFLEPATEDTTIRLPIFEQLHTLHLYLSDGDSNPVRRFEMGSFPVHFPKLVHLEMNEHAFENMNMYPVEPIHLPSLIIRNNDRVVIRTPPNIHPVELLRYEGWRESLKVLEINRVQSTLQMPHATSLEELIVEEYWLKYLPKNYLDFFEQVRTLKLSSITFKSYDGPTDEEIKARFRSYFPFPVKFQRNINSLYRAY